MTSLPNVNSNLTEPTAVNPLESAGNWNEPKTAYGKIKGKKIKPKKGKISTIYPFNKVYESESGHVIEIDDTPGSERIHQFHRSGTFQEIHPNGDSVTKVVRDNYTSILRDNYVHIDGHCNVTIDKALKILVNSDKNENTPSKSTNFDIEVGDNANINILVNKGNCQVRLKDGDANVLIDRGDVNIRQDAGNYNHFVNGDYNLEIAGHMHVVVGEDYVNEIGGSRDVRVDGLFDHLFVTTGYLETSVPKNDLRYTVGKDKQELIAGTYYQSALGKVTVIQNSEEKTIGNLYSIKSTSIGMMASQDINLGTLSSGVNLNEKGELIITSTKTFDVVSGKISITSYTDIDITSQTNLNLSSTTSTNLYSSGNLLIGSDAIVGINSSSGIYQTSSLIHLNGPPAPQPLKITPLISIYTPPELPKKPFTYTQGNIGKWRKSVNGVTPLVLVRTSVTTLKSQLAALDTAANTVNGLKEQTGGLISSITDVQNNISSVTPTTLTTLATQTSNIANSTNSVVETVSTTVDTTTNTIQGVTDTVSSISSEMVGPLKNVIGDDGPLAGIKGAISTVTGFIGDIISTVADIACSIVDAIGSIVDTVVKSITDAIKTVLEAISSVVEAIASIIQAVTKIIADALKQITDLIASIINAAGEFINGIIDSIASIFDGIGGGRPSNCGLSLGLNIGGTSVGIATAPGG